MNLNHSTEMVFLFEQIFNTNDCHKLALQQRFIERSSSKIRGDEFIKALVLPSDGASEDSLNGLCIRIRQFNPDADISPQALAERINHISSHKFLRAVFSKILAISRRNIVSQEPLLAELAQKFSDVLIEDSTVCELHEKLRSKYEGTNRGGRGCKSQVKIDLIHSLITGSVVNVLTCDGNKPDQGLAGRILDVIKEGELVIRDLGYFALEIFKQIDGKGSYFLTRLPPHVKVFLRAEDAMPTDLGKYVDKHYRNTNVIDLKMFLGDVKQPARVVLYRVPQEVVDKRLREAHKRAKDAGRILSKAKKTLLKFSMFATNVCADILPAKEVGTLYRLRWEIELIFKQWKSQLKIDILKGINPHRIECLIWARLCTTVLIAMTNKMFAVIAQTRFNIELSPTKLISYFMRGGCLAQAVMQSRELEFIEDVMNDFRRRLCKDKRQRKTMRRKIADNEDYYGCVSLRGSYAS